MSATFKFAAAALVLSAFAPAAFADTPPEQVSLRIAYGDLDMSAPPNGERLLGRIEKAARKVCNKAVPHSPLLARQAIDCRKETVASTVRSLGLPMLTVAWSGKYEPTAIASR